MNELPPFIQLENHGDGDHLIVTSHSKKCKHCNVILTQENAAKKNAKYWRNECKPCRSKIVTNYGKINLEKRRDYQREWIKRTGRVKQYPCEKCGKLAYKKYAKSFCSDECRFMFYVEVSDDCWLWKGALNRFGYGKLFFRDKRSQTAHRVSYLLFKGNIPDNLSICHSCDIRNCVKPAHLWLGTNMENMMDMVEKGRQHSKLTPSKVLKIRELVEKFGVKQKKICEEFGINDGTVSSIIHRRIWKHI